MSQTRSIRGLQLKLLAPFLGAMLLFVLAIHFLLLPARLAAAQENFRRTQQGMLAILTPALTDPLLSEDSASVHAMLGRVGRDNPQWVSITLDDAQGRRLYPLEAPNLSSGNEIIAFDEALNYRDRPLARLRVATDPSAVLRTEAARIRRLE